MIYGVASALVGTVCFADAAAVEASLSARWTAAYNSGDIAALSAMYAVDARVQQGYCPTVTGRDAIEEFWRSDLGDGTTKTYLEIEDTLNADGLMYLGGRYAVKIAATSASAARRVGGTYTQVWRHEDSTGWPIHRETWANLACAEVVVEPPKTPEEEPAEPATTI